MNSASHALRDYQVGRRIAVGGFGFVYSGEAPDGKAVAIKYERTYSTITRPYLKHEADVSRLLEGNSCVPSLYAYGREERWNIMVLDLLGPSLELLFKICGHKFSLKTTLMIALQMLECIEYVHSKGVIHRDIKPDNFLLGKPASDAANAVHIIDFGLARRYRHPETLEHFPYSEGLNFFGTTRFASLNSHLGRSQSRRDDLESAAYTFIYFLRGKLPWQSLRGGTGKHREDRVKEKKKTWSSSRLCEGLPEESRYDQEPDYEYMKDLFRSLLNREGFELDYDYDWLSLPEERESEIAEDEIVPDSDSEGGKVVEEVNLAADSLTDAESPTTSEDCAFEDLQLSPLESDEEEAEYFSSESNPAPVTDDNSAPEHIEYFYPEPDPDDENAEQVSSGSHYDAASRSSGASSPPASTPPVKKGDYVLVKLSARPTLEYDEGWSADSNAESDNSYWCSPSLSRVEWRFPWRPALVLDVHAGHAYTRLFLLPLMRRPAGLDSIAPPRRSAFVPVKAGKLSTNSGAGTDGVEIVPTPAWPLDNTYHYHQSDVFKVLVSTDRTRSVNVHWRLPKEQVARLLAARDDALSAIYDNDVHSYDSEITQDVKQTQGKKHFVEHYPVFGDVTSLTEDAFSQSDVDFLGSNGWLPEFNKMDRRRKGENCWHPDGGGDGDDDDENISMYTGPTPSNRRLSITLAIPADAIMDSSVIDSTET
ncbi:kinase-like domain-containing protein [Phellopilus nigrolimitatus]|nr:kinase-like domain-containing protein [Phellopilus nigrolimitatus]